jgi:hypothetical protein
MDVKTVALRVTLDLKPLSIPRRCNVKYFLEVLASDFRGSALDKYKLGSALFLSGLFVTFLARSNSGNFCGAAASIASDVLIVVTPDCSKAAALTGTVRWILGAGISEVLLIVECWHWFAAIFAVTIVRYVRSSS